MKGGLALALLLVAAPYVRADETGRYTFGGAAEQGTFVLDTESGRVWRYDRVDDAWYLYDLEALVRTPRGESRARGLSGETPGDDRGDRNPGDERPPED